MKLDIDAARLAAWLKDFPDAEELGDGEWALDLYDSDPPAALEIALAEGAAEVVAAFGLAYSEDFDGWFAGARIEDPDMLTRMVAEAMAGKAAPDGGAGE